MPRFFLDLYDGDCFTRDPYGFELDGYEEARREAISALPDMARDVLPDGDRRDFTVDVRTAVGEVIYTATLSLAGRWLKGLDKQADRGSPAYDATASDGRAARSGERVVIATPAPPAELLR